MRETGTRRNATRFTIPRDVPGHDRTHALVVPVPLNGAVTGWTLTHWELGGGRRGPTGEGWKPAGRRLRGGG